MKQVYFGNVSVRSLSERIIEGRAITFEVESNIICENDMIFTETIKRGAVTLELLDNSNVVLTFNHQMDDILGRSKNNQGTLKLMLRDDGLYFSVVAPHTRFGDECLERVQRGDILDCSFMFSVRDEDMKWSFSNIEGVLHRDIYRLNSLADCSIVVNPAYPETFVHARSLELKNAKDNMIEQKEEEEKVETRAAEEPKKEEEEENVEETSKEETPKNEEIPEKEDKLNNDGESKEDETPKEEESKEEEPEDEKKNQKRNLNNSHKFMKKNVTLVQLIRSAMDKNEKRFNVSLETRAGDTMTFASKAVEGGDPDPYYTEDTTVENEFQSLVEPLYNNQVIKGLGIRIMTGAPKGIITVPIIDKGTVGWASEIATAVKSGNTTSNVTLSPHRICAYVDISRAMLLTDTLGVNEAIRRDLYNAIADAVQNAILDNAAETSDRPAGLLHGLTATSVSTFGGLCDLEADLQDANFENVQYLCSNKAYAKLRALPKSSKTNELTIGIDGTIDGTPVTRTGALSGTNIVLGDFSNIVMGVWQDAEVVVDETSHAAEGFVRLVINMYVDFKAVRPAAFKLATI